MKKILIVDDDTDILTHLTNVLKRAGYETDAASSAKEAIKKVEATAFDVVLLDFMMPKTSGISLLPEIRRLRPMVKVIMITAFATIENAIDAIKNGACGYIAKPFKIEELLTTVRRALEEKKFEEGIENMDMDHTLSSLSSPIRRKILRMLSVRATMRLMELTRELGIEDHTKVNFHMKILKEAGVIQQDPDKSYSLTTEGKRTLECMKTIEKYISE